MEFAAPQVTESDIQRTSWQRDIKNLLAESESTTTSIDRMAGAAGTPDPQFDAIGWLMPVHSTRRAAPPFALLDDDGRVICYVQAAPGLNLRRYAKKHVGLFGNQRFITDLRASLITVSRVVKQKD